MESSTETPTPDDAAAVLNDAEASRTKLAASIALPSFFYWSIGIAIAIQIATAAIGVSVGNTTAMLVLAAGVVVFVTVATVQLLRFRALNGAWVGGLASKVVLGGATLASTTYMLALGGAVWAAFEDVWWLVGVCAVAGGVSYALSGLHWLRSYRDDPGTHGRGDPAWWLALVCAVAVAGLVALVILS